MHSTLKPNPSRELKQHLAAKVRAQSLESLPLWLDTDHMSPNSWAICRAADMKSILPQRLALAISSSCNVLLNVGSKSEGMTLLTEQIWTHVACPPSRCNLPVTNLHGRQDSKTRKASTPFEHQRAQEGTPSEHEKIWYTCLAQLDIGKSVFVFCCLVFSVVWAFRVLFFAVCAGCRVCFCCLAGGGGGVVLYFLAVWAGERVFFFSVWTVGAFTFYAAWAGVVSFFSLFGQGTGVHSLTGLPGSSSSDPTTKRTKQQTTNHGFP